MSFGAGAGVVCGAQVEPLAKPVAGDAAIFAAVIGPYAPSSAILSLGLLRFHSRWNANTLSCRRSLVPPAV